MERHDPRLQGRHHRGGRRTAGPATDSGVPAAENTGAALQGKSLKQAGTGQDVAGGHSVAGSGEGSQQAGRPIREHGEAAGGQREAKLTDAHERSRLRRESNERDSEQRRLAREAPKPPKISSHTPPTEQELAERHERRKQANEKGGPKATRNSRNRRRTGRTAGTAQAQGGRTAPAQAR